MRGLWVKVFFCMRMLLGSGTEIALPAFSWVLCGVSMRDVGFFLRFQHGFVDIPIVKVVFSRLQETYKEGKRTT